MSAGAFETDVGVIFGERIDEQPVRFDVAITVACEISAQRVILEELRQWTSVNQQFQDSLQLRQVFAALLCAFDVLLELTGATEGSQEKRGSWFLNSQIGKEFFFATEPFHVSALFTGFEDGCGELVR